VTLSASSGTLVGGATTTVTVSLNANADALTPGDYSDTVSFVNTSTGNGNTTRSISLTVNSTGLLTISPAAGLSSSGTVGGPFTPSSIVYTLTNPAGSSLNWTASETQSWLSLSATNGTLAAGASTSVTVLLNSAADSLAAGNYSDTVSFVNATTGNGNTSRNVSLTVNSAGQLGVTPAGDVNASGMVGGPFSPRSISYMLTNSGGTTLNWVASKMESWASLSASGGTLDAGSTTAVTVSLNANADALIPGAYSDTVSFVNTSTGNGNTTRSVSLTVNSAGQLAVTPEGDVNASGTVGGPFSPSSISYTLTNSGGTTLDWTASKTESWVSLSASSGSLAARTSTSITVSINANANNLAAGRYSDAVVFADTGAPATPHSRSIDLEVTPLIILLAEIGSADQFQITLQGQPYQTYVIEASTNLVYWSGIETNTAGADGTVIHLDTEGLQMPNRYYRGRPHP
jgi:hypothetical protein